jgi:hypothetical protein
MKTFFAWFSRLILGAAFCHGLVASAAPALHSAFPLESDFAKADATKSVVTGALDLGSGLKLPVRIETTNQGNGVLTVANLTLRLMDKHDDGLVYGGSGVLRLDIVRLGPGRAPASVVISGIALHTGDKESDPSVSESIVYVYRVNCAAGTLVRSWRNTDIEIELDTKVKGKIHCAN